MDMRDNKLAQRKHRRPTKQSGQLLIIVIIILGVLLILGFAFSSIIGRNVTETGRASQRTLAGDMARSAVDMAHDQLMNSALGADWRPDATPVTFDVAGMTRDPDALYLRPGSGLAVEPDPVGRPGEFVTDLGGPDYLGPYSRVGYRKGRALLRVRYQPANYEALVNPTGSLRRPGQARNLIVIESVGRAGALNSQGKIDPSQQLNAAVKVSNYIDAVDLRNSLGAMKGVNAAITDSRKQMAFASIGLTDFSRFVTNKDKVDRPIPFGFPTPSIAGSWKQGLNVGALNEGQAVQVQTTTGINGGVNNIPVNPANWLSFPGGGGMHVNGELEVHGNLDVVLNRHFGENITATDGIKAANDASTITLRTFGYSTGPNTWVQTGAPILGAAQMDSGNPNFNTVAGALVDGNDQTDFGGYGRAGATIAAPSITTKDSKTGQNRYRVMTQQSGIISANRNTGTWGYGEGIYIDSSERANRPSEEVRANQDPSKSLPLDWLNPNNSDSLGWVGPYYIPVAPSVILMPDGFRIVRDGRSNIPTWIDPATGGNTGQAENRYFVRIIAGEKWIADAISSPAGTNFNAIGDPQFQALGRRFNGVLMFEGDVRVRGVIPTDVQITLTSLGTIYVDGSITKGVVARSAGGAPVVIDRPSQSMISLLANDFVAVNTTMFFGPDAGEIPQSKAADGLPDTPNPFELDLAVATELSLTTQFLLEPNGINPTTWVPFMEQYTAAPGFSVAGPIASKIMMSVSADDNGPAFAGINVEPDTFRAPGAPSDPYLFPTVINLGGPTIPFNQASIYFVATDIPVYGLGDPSTNAYPKFETVATTIHDGTTGVTFNNYSTVSRQVISTGANPQGLYALAVEDPTIFRLQLSAAGGNPSKNFLVSRTAIQPFDVRIEAVMYAQNGSFFVIPGPWFNPNSADTRTAFEQNYTPADTSDDLDATIPSTNPTYSAAVPANLQLAKQRRFERFGNSPEVPFFGEPLDVKVSIIGSISENMPAPMSQQSEWLKKWGWIPRRLAGTGGVIPADHLPLGAGGPIAAPNFTVTYDPVLGASATPTAGLLVPLRTDAAGRTLPPTPRLPVSPTLVYFGDETS